MKKFFYLCLAVLLFSACNEAKTVKVTLANSLSIDRNNEMVELSMNDISTKLGMSADAQIVIRDAKGTEVAHQITSNGQLIFAANIPADSTAVYSIQVGTPEQYSVIACGRHYPERVDDIAWENDLVAFRTYGPALQQKGERAFGYDVWTKRETSAPVVEERYAMELDPAIKKSYHVDHGNGLDCYKVGPTLGGGTAALMADGEIVYPYCYKDYEILDNGPLRFAVKLVYHPMTVKGNENVVETRIIVLDAGSYLNRTIVHYSGLNENTDIAAGIVLHEPDGEAVIAADAAAGYMTYIDPTDNPTAGNGDIFIGAAFPGALKEAKALYFSKEESEKERGGANGHVLAISNYQPGSSYVYYWGAAWSKAGMDSEKWNNYVAEYAQKVRNPLMIIVQ